MLTDLAAALDNFVADLTKIADDKTANAALTPTDPQQETPLSAEYIKIALGSGFPMMGGELPFLIIPVAHASTSDLAISAGIKELEDIFAYLTDFDFGSATKSKTINIKITKGEAVSYANVELSFFQNTYDRLANEFDSSSLTFGRQILEQQPPQIVKNTGMSDADYNRGNNEALLDYVIERFPQGATEDLNNNGILDAGEDRNNNGAIDDISNEYKNISLPA